MVLAPLLGMAIHSSVLPKLRFSLCHRYSQPVTASSFGFVHDSSALPELQVAVSPVAAGAWFLTVTCTVSAAELAPTESLTARLKESTMLALTDGAVKVGKAAVALLSVTAFVIVVAGGVGTCVQA